MQHSGEARYQDLTADLPVGARVRHVHPPQNPPEKLEFPPVVLPRSRRFQRGTVQQYCTVARSSDTCTGICKFVSPRTGSHRLGWDREE
eukprot:COSAG02_NODE_5015_length_4723_cov_3.671064_3_plen_89_part_00